MQVLYTVLMLLTVVTQFGAVFLATAASIVLMTGKLDPLAEDPVALLERELEYEYITTSFCAQTGLLLFVAALALRSYAAFPGPLGKACVVAFGTFCTAMLAWDARHPSALSYVQLAARWCTLAVGHGVSTGLGLVTLLGGFTTAALIAKAFGQPLVGPEWQNGAASVSSTESASAFGSCY